MNMNVNNVNSNFIGNGADNDTMQLMYECFRSYLEHSHSDLIYASVNENQEKNTHCNAMEYSETVKRVENGDYGSGMPINCSTFVNLMLLGVPYEHSRYFKEDPHRDGHSAKVTQNDIGAAGYCANLLGRPITVDNYREIRFCQDLYNQFKALGRGFAVETAFDLSNILPGDVLFWGYEFNGERVMTHVAMVMARMGEYDGVNNAKVLLLYVDAKNARNDTSFPIGAVGLNYSNYDKGFTVTNEYGTFKSQICYVGRPEYVRTKAAAALLAGSYSTPSNDVEVTMSNVKSCDIVTVEVDWTPTSNVEAIQVLQEGVEETIVTFRVEEGMESNKNYHIVNTIPLEKRDDTSGENWTASAMKFIAYDTTTKKNATTLPLKNIRIYRGVKSRTVTDAGIELQAGDDLDALPIGKAQAPSGAVAKNVEHTPSDHNFTIWTFYRVNGLKTQVAIDYAGNIHVRSQGQNSASNNTYDDWYHHYNSLGLPIAANSNLDNLPLGKAYAATQEIAESLTNRPVAANFSIWTFYRTAEYKTQVLIDVNNNIFVRSQTFDSVTNKPNGSSYGSWWEHTKHVER